MRFSIFQPAYVCAPLSLPCYTFYVYVCVCIYWLFAQNYEIISTWVQLPQAHTHTQTATYCNALHTHIHIHTQKHTHSPADGLRVVRPFSNFAASSSRGALHVISPSLPLSLSLPLSTIGFRVLCARHRHHHHQQTGNIGKFMAIGIREHRF